MTALAVGALIGLVTGFGAGNAMMLVVGPIMGGGMAAGAVPMSEIYASATEATPPGSSNNSPLRWSSGT
ncbi:hypothetical protein GCM10009755_20780 [Brevibacterium samyangense]|uniref:Uncharacterized protein n=1 Tax=Brevibacterium samyangense TaxID=366888 RepID=A0ABN2THI2_9MICO